MTENVRTQIDKLEARMEGLDSHHKARLQEHDWIINRLLTQVDRIGNVLNQLTGTDWYAAPTPPRPATATTGGDRRKVERFDPVIGWYAPEPSPAPAEAMASLATRLLQLTINDAPIDPQLAVDLARQLVDLDVVELAAPDDRTVVVPEWVDEIQIHRYTSPETLQPTGEWRATLWTHEEPGVITCRYAGRNVDHVQAIEAALRAAERGENAR